MNRLMEGDSADPEHTFCMQLARKEKEAVLGSAVRHGLRMS